MNILHVVPTYLPATRYGGPIYSVHALCKHLTAAGHHVEVFTTSVDGPADSDVPHDRPVTMDGVQVHYARSRHLRRLYYSNDLNGLLKSRIRSFDLVHLHSVFLWPTFAAARAAHRAQVPYVLSPRGMLVADLIERRSTWLKRAWIALIERRNLRQAAAVHLTSREEERSLAELGLALAPTVIIPNGTDRPEPFSPASVSADVKAAVAAGYDILSFGRINWKKGLDRLIRAIAEIPSAKAVIAGHDEDGEAERLRTLARECRVGDRVRFIPRQIGGADKEALFASAKVFAMPSLSENFGNVAVEAMVRRLPVVVTEAVGAAEIAAKSGGGLVSGNGQEAFTAALRELLASPERMARMGMAGEAYAREHLDWTGVGRQFADVYQDVCRTSRRAT